MTTFSPRDYEESSWIMENATDCQWHSIIFAIFQIARFQFCNSIFLFWTFMWSELFHRTGEALGASAGALEATSTACP
jgi:hypothetical protein